MSTSQTTGLSKPTAAYKISIGTLGYINARNRQRAYNLVIREFKKSGLTQAALASRLGKTADVICRLLARPRNWELDTFSSLLFGISGAVPQYEATYPLGAPGIAEQSAFDVKRDSTTECVSSVVPLQTGQFETITQMAA